MADTIQVSDAQVQAYYNAHKDDYRTPERVHARHILLSITNKPKDEVPKIQAQAEALDKQIKAAADFAELAKKNSQDPGSAQKGGDLGWVSRGQMVKNFEDAVFTLKPNEISNVVTTEYGFHIIQVLEKQPAHLQTLDEVKPAIIATLKNQTVFDRMQDLADKAHAELVKAPQNAQQIATQLNLEFVDVPAYAPGSPIRSTWQRSSGGRRHPNHEARRGERRAPSRQQAGGRGGYRYSARRIPRNCPKWRIRCGRIICRARQIGWSPKRRPKRPSCSNRMAAT